MSQPLKLPLQLLPVWADPAVGSEFLGRYEVKKALPDRPGAKGQLFEVFDKQSKQTCGLQVCSLLRDTDVKAFVERLQLEALDTEDRLFMRLRDVALALPGRLAILEDLPSRSLWDDFERTEPAGMAAKVAAVANAVLGGLCRLHATGWAHCGVSPLTVGMSADGAWKLTSLESAKRVREVAGATPALTGTAAPPEVLLGLPVTEKVDVWQLAATLCEAIMRKRISQGVDGASAGIPEKLVSLVNFLGPLPENLVARHPNREDLFTPEGHVLRPTTPGKGEQALEALEPAKAGAPAGSGPDSIPRPLLVAEALSGVDGANEILEFLGRLLIPDPEQRPSATEAMAHHFLRFAHTKGAAGEDGKHTHFAGDEGEDSPKPAKADGGGKLARKGTGFVHVGDLPDDDDEDDEEEEEDPPKYGSKNQNHVQIQDTGAGNAKDKGDAGGKLARKGTGFVHMGDLPDDDDDDDEEEEEAKHVKIADATPQGAGKKEGGGTLARKGTGFVHMGDLPDDDDDDEDEEEAPPTKGRVQVQESKEVSGKKPAGGPLARKGTGFVHMGDLPDDDDDEDEDEEEEAAAKPKHVAISSEAKFEDKKHQQAAAPQKGPVRKGTGFIHAGDLPSDDEEDDEDEDDVPRKAASGHKVQIEETGGGQGGTAGGGKLARKGTGFVHTGELPVSDDEDEDEEEEDKPAAKKVNIQAQDEDGAAKKVDGGGKMGRKGTGFVNVGDLPDDSEDEDEDEDAQGGSNKHVGWDATAATQEKQKPAGGGGPMRKGTGFVNAGDIPDSDEDEDDEDEAPAKGNVQFDKSAQETQAKQPAAGGGKVQRKGTGFVHMSDIVDSDEDDED